MSVVKVLYYHGVLSQEGAESRLDKKGDFLLRRDTPDEALVLSVNVDKGIFHHQVLVMENGKYRLPRKLYVNTEEEYINYFYEYKFPILDNVFLLSPIQPQSDDQSMMTEVKPMESIIVTGKDRPIEQLPYYHGLLGQMETENLLKNDGDFLLRRDPPDEALVLSVNVDKGIFHHQVLIKYGGIYELPKIPRKRNVSWSEEVKIVQTTGHDTGCKACQAEAAQPVQTDSSQESVSSASLSRSIDYMGGVDAIVLDPEEKGRLVVEPQDGVYKLPAEPHVKTVEEYISYLKDCALPIVPGAFLENPIDSNKF